MRLSPRFVEWMMGLPEGWVTEVPGMSRTEQLKALGNGVVPQQCVLALVQLLRLVVPESGTDFPGRSLPTPRSARGASGLEMMYALGGARSDAIRPQGAILLPTPQAFDHVEPKKAETIVRHRSEGRGGDANLRETVLFELEERLPIPRRSGSGEQVMLPTPNVSDAWVGDAAVSPESAQRQLRRNKPDQQVVDPKFARYVTRSASRRTSTGSLAKDVLRNPETRLDS